MTAALPGRRLWGATVDTRSQTPTDQHVAPTRRARRPLHAAVARRRDLRRVGLAATASAFTGLRREPTILWIVGCPHSGSSLLERLLTPTPDVYVFGERSRLSRRDPESLRLDPPDQLADRFAHVPHVFATATVLADSHQITELLNAFPTSRALWLFGDPAAFARSRTARCGEQQTLADIDRLLDDDPDHAWQAAGRTAFVDRIVRELRMGDLTAHEAAASFWWARNQLAFALGLTDDPRIAFLDHGHLRQRAAAEVQALLDWLAIEQPAAEPECGIGPDTIDDAQIEHPPEVHFRPEVAALCDDLFTQLCALDASPMTRLRTSRGPAPTRSESGA